MQHTTRKIININSEKNYESKKKNFVSLYKDSISNNKEVDFTKKTSNLFRKQKNKKAKKINSNIFNKILSIDTEKQIATVEAMIRFEDLVTKTLEHGYLPPVVPQLKTITLGGAISGVGIEASSFKYGLVHETVLEMEVMLSDGKVITCSPSNEYKDLFFSLPNSYGTLGYILKVKIPLVKIKPYVKIAHQKYSDQKEYFTNLDKKCRDEKYDFVDGVVFDKKLMYISTGNFTDNAPYVSNYKYMGIYYKSIFEKKDDYLTTKDYIWRWDTDWFWCSKMFFMQNTVLRFLLGKFMLGSRAYWKIARFEEKHQIQSKLEKMFTGKFTRKESVVQDVSIPIENCSKFLDFFHKNIGIKPIWICPFKSYNKKHDFDLFSHDPNELYVDFGFWDVVPSDKPKGYYNKLIEKKVEEFGGKKSLYSESYYKRDKFYQIYNGKKYFKLKEKYDPSNNFSDLYERCVKNK